MRNVIEPQLQEYTKQWRLGTVSTDDGVDVVDYFVQLKKKTMADDLVALVRAAGSKQVIDAELL
jgi:hypothetical protein